MEHKFYNFPYTAIPRICLSRNETMNLVSILSGQDGPLLSLSCIWKPIPNYFIWPLDALMKNKYLSTEFNSLAKFNAYWGNESLIVIGSIMPSIQGVCSLKLQNKIPCSLTFFQYAFKFVPVDVEWFGYI